MSVDYMTILKKINQRGWNVYSRGKSDSTIPKEETVGRGPVSSLEPGILYLILPIVSNPRNEESIHEFIEKYQTEPSIRVPSTQGYAGSCIIKFSETDPGDEHHLIPEEVLDAFIGFEILKDKNEVRLLLPNRSFMPYDVFLEALDSLNDISELKRDQF